MTDAPDDKRTSVRKRHEQRQGSIPAPDGLLPPSLWGVGLVKIKPPKEGDAEGHDQ